MLNRANLSTDSHSRARTAVPLLNIYTALTHYHKTLEVNYTPLPSLPNIFTCFRFRRQNTKRRFRKCANPAKRDFPILLKSKLKAHLALNETLRYLL